MALIEQNTQLKERPQAGSAKADRARRLARLDRVASLMDTRFRIPGLGLRFGWDSILGLVPGAGDLITALPAAYMIYEGYRLGARRRLLGQMAMNSALDLVIGGVPVLGDAFDLFFKSHKRNMALLRDELGAAERSAPA